MEDAAIVKEPTTLCCKCELAIWEMSLGLPPGFKRFPINARWCRDDLVGFNVVTGKALFSPCAEVNRDGHCTSFLQKQDRGEKPRKRWWQRGG